MAIQSLLWSAMVLWTTGFAAVPPQYDDDPFGDDLFTTTPLILEVAYPRQGRGELSQLVAASFVNKYNAHLGGLIELQYQISDTLGVGASFGYLHGRLTSIVTDAYGILGNRVAACQDNPKRCGELDPDVPDYRQITGVADLLATWTPLYGKISLVSEVDLSLEIYLLGGVGVHGTRLVRAQVDEQPATRTDYHLAGGGLGQGGMFSRPFFNWTAGAGLRLLLLERLTARLEFRGLWFRDKFDFGQGRMGYVSSHYLANAGVGVLLW